MFNNAQHTQITGGTFNFTTNPTNINKANALDVLHKHVAPNAILNAGGRADEVRCHPGTREEVIGRIEKWRDAKDDQTPPIFWLSGPAGAGKSAIMQTIAERCDKEGKPQANFFFFRADSSRSNSASLVATLVQQVIRLYPSLRDSIAGEFSDNPLILDSTLEEKLSRLLVIPLRDIQQSSSSYSPLLFIIDGLDECDSETKNSQQLILHAFDRIFAERPCPFRLLVASRDESQISSAFNKISSPFLSLYLDGEYSPEGDIRVFVNALFDKVRKTHPLAHTLDATWPFVEDVDDIVKKSAGQFIYAATVMRFISDSSASPAISLKRVQGAAHIATKLPFSHLDAIYTHILSQVDDQESLKDILHGQFLINDSHSEIKLAAFLKIYDSKYADAFIRSCLADLTSIAQYSDDGELLFHHASFSEYLLDRSRSKDYSVDTDAFNFKTLPAVWKGIRSHFQVSSVSSFSSKLSDADEHEANSTGINRPIQPPSRVRKPVPVQDSPSHQSYSKHVPPFVGGGYTFTSAPYASLGSSSSGQGGGGDRGGSVSGAGQRVVHVSPKTKRGSLPTIAPRLIQPRSLTLFFEPLYDGWLFGSVNNISTRDGVCGPPKFK